MRGNERRREREEEKSKIESTQTYQKTIGRIPAATNKTTYLISDESSSTTQE